jgi:hypothetical protein
MGFSVNLDIGSQLCWLGTLMWHVLIECGIRWCGMLLKFLELFLMEKGGDFIEFLELFSMKKDVVA